MWKADFGDLITKKTAPSIQDDKAIEKMEASITWCDGHYQLKLPWNGDGPRTNKPHAYIRAQQLQKKLMKDPQLHNMYCEQLEDYLTQGYAEEAPQGTTKRPVWYLPHHPITSTSNRKPGKVRMVFDGAAKYHGASQNNHLLQGPDFTNSQTEILVQFLQNQVAVTADIQALYHQVMVPEEDRNVLRFLWWPNGDLDEDLKEYRMTRHVFGLRSSPSCAFSNAAVSSVLNDFYNVCQ